MTIDPSAITIPQDRSMPAVRMTIVWPMAITPTTITCCRISEMFGPVRNRSVWNAKNTQARRSARIGPDVGMLGRCPRIEACLAISPAGVHAERRVPAVHARHRPVGNERYTGIGRARRLLAVPRILGAGLDAERCHLEGVLLR